MCLIVEHAHLKHEHKLLLTENGDLKEVNKSIISMNDEANLEIRKLHGEVARLQSLIPVPVEELKPCGTIDINLMSSILLDKLEEMKDTQTDIRLPDTNCKVYKKEDVIKFLALDETDKIPYEPDNPEIKKSGDDCDGIAAIMYGKVLGLLWTNVHALNWFVDENNTLWFVEPQTDRLSQTLDNWQGWDVRFFLGR